MVFLITEVTDMSDYEFLVKPQLLPYLMPDILSVCEFLTVCRVIDYPE